MVYRFRPYGLVAAVLLLVVSAGCGPLKPAENSSVMTIRSGVTVDLRDGTIRTTAIGKKPEGMSDGAQAKLMARRAAVTIANRNLAEALLELDNKAHGRQNTDPARFTAAVRGQRIVGEEMLADGSYKVIMEIKLDEELLRQLRTKGN